MLLYSHSRTAILEYSHRLRQWLSSGTSSDTPYSSVSTGSAEEEYNTAHSRERCVVERCNGVLKIRFRCLLKHRTLHYMPEEACRIINSCIILHNLCIEGEMKWEDIDLPDEDALFNTVVE
ncbi:hypothetical protein AVEN_259247-1 [Araneus ventricosus]|uniref:DDE Tnp4 domain-containing protein n=1 Tax=Araneus ventricosus TaxID=182803 RepID=A0A4Y2R7R0_ARAVE|nr:hypothetical protein AVEN_259247-1 [Araneus ventricosus]